MGVRADYVPNFVTTTIENFRVKCTRYLTLKTNIEISQTNN